MASILTYNACKKLITIKEYNQEQYDDMMVKLDVFLLADRITKEQYNELKGMLDAKLTNQES